jgi:hypothetical protein
MPNQESEHLKRAAEYWNSGQPLQAGKLIFENLPNEARPKWASRILRIILERSGIQSSLFDPILHTADHQPMWGNGHRVFSTLRASTLKLDDMKRTKGATEAQKLFGYILSLAELVAKVTYNATNPPDEFDEDSGWWIAACLRCVVDHRWKDEHFAKAAWSALCSQEG